MERSHQPGDIIAQRYQMIRILGQGGTGTTYEAQDQKNNQRVAIKEMSLRRLKEWKDLDLFEREARVLSYLDHPAIPKYLNYFEIDTPQNRLFYIVQELAPGQSLFDLVQSGWHTNEDEIKDIALQVLETLTYLHNFSPPIIHRDIKPQNIIRRDDGRVFLVDFGSVRHAYWNRRNQGITVVGTFGYMAPEQDRGQAYPASDLYGLAATLLFLLTHRSPAELPQQRLKIDFRSRANVSPQFANWLEKMLEPVVEDRFLSTREALKTLQEQPNVANSAILIRRPPAGSRISLTTTDKRLVMKIPPTGFGGTGGYLSSSAWILVLTALTVLAVLGIVIKDAVYTLIYIGSIILISGMKRGIGFDTLLRLAGHTRLEIDPQNFHLQWMLLGLQRQIRGQTGDISHIEIVTKYIQKVKFSSKTQKYTVPVKKCAIITHTPYQTYEFAGLTSQREKEWLMEELTAFLEKLRLNQP